MNDDFLHEFRRPARKSVKQDLIRKLKALEEQEDNMTLMPYTMTKPTAESKQRDDMVIIPTRSAHMQRPYGIRRRTVLAVSASVAVFSAVFIGLWLFLSPRRPISEMVLSGVNYAALQGLQPITPENVANLELLNVLGDNQLTNGTTWSPDDTTIAVGSAKGVLLFAASDLQAEPRLLPFENLQSPTPISRIQFSPDGTHLAASRGTQLYFWNVLTDTLEHIHEEALNIGTFSFAPDGNTLAFTPQLTGFYSLDENRTIYLYDVPAQAVTNTIQSAASIDIHSLQFSPDGRFLAYSAGSAALFVYDLVDPSNPMGASPISLSDPTVEWTSITEWAFTVPGNAINVVTSRGSLVPEFYVWRIELSGTALATKIAHLVSNPQFPPTANMIFDDSGLSFAVNLGTISRGIAFFDIPEQPSPDGIIGADILIPRGNSPTGYASFSFSHDGQRLFGFGGNSLITVDVKTPTPMVNQQVTYGGLDIITTNRILMGQTPDSPLVSYRLTAPDSLPELMVWSPLTGEHQEIDVMFMGEAPQSLDISADGRYLVLGYPNNMRVLNLNNGESLWARQYINEYMVGNSQQYAQVRFGDTWVASINTHQHTANFWDALTGEPLDSTVLAGRPDAQNVPARFVVTSTYGDPNKAVIWDIFTGQILREFEHQYILGSELTHNPEQLYIYGAIYGSNDELTIWNWRTGELVSSLKTDLEIFSPDGSNTTVTELNTSEHLLVIGAMPYPPNRPTQLSFWNVENGQQVGNFLPGISNDDALLLSPDDRLLIMSGSDGLIRVYGVRG